MKTEQIQKRKTEYDIDKIFVERSSPRAMSGEEISDSELMPLFEAARWAPSNSNNQPWRFVYAKRNTENWDKFFDLLMEGNKTWAKNASALVIMLSRKRMEYKDYPNKTHSFDTGSAWMSLAIEGARRNLVVHGMGGFDYDKAKEMLGLTDLYNVEAMAAIGKYADKKVLTPKDQEREKPSLRKKVNEIAFEGKFDSEK